MKLNQAAVRISNLAAIFMPVFIMALLVLRPEFLAAKNGGMIYFLMSVMFFCLVTLAAAVQGRIAVSFPLPGLFLGLAWVATVLPPVLIGSRPAGGMSSSLPALGNFIMFLGFLAAASDRDFGKIALKSVCASAFMLSIYFIWLFAVEGKTGGNSFADIAGNGPAPREAGLERLLLLVIPCTMGFLFNSIHEKMDPSVAARRLLYGICLAIFPAALYFSGTVTSWIALAGGAFLFFAFAGAEYIRRNLNGLLVAAALVAVAVSSVVVLTALLKHPLEGYRDPVGQIAGVFEGWSRLGPSIPDIWLSGSGFHPGGFEASAKGFPQPAGGAGPSWLTLVLGGGVPMAGCMALFFISSFATLYPRGNVGLKEYEMPGVDVLKRRTVPAVELAIAGAFGGVAAIFAAGRCALPLDEILVILTMIPAWLIFHSVSFSYKHFSLNVFNKRDFVSIGIAGGAAAVMLHGFADPILCDFPVMAVSAAFLAIACGRAAHEPGREKLLELRDRKALRISLGITSATMLLASAGMLARLALFSEIQVS